jgi:hypothetical protein
VSQPPPAQRRIQRKRTKGWRRARGRTGERYPPVIVGGRDYGRLLHHGCERKPNAKGQTCARCRKDAHRAVIDLVAGLQRVIQTGDVVELEVLHALKTKIEAVLGRSERPATTH